MFFIFASIKSTHIHEVIASDNFMDNKALNVFKPSIIKDIADYSFLISEEENKLAIRYNGHRFHMKPVILDIDNISNLEISKNNQVIQSGAIGRSVVGGIIAGGFGAIVGANTAKQKEQVESIGIKFVTKDVCNPIIRLELYGVIEKIKYEPNTIYRQLEELIAILEIVKEKDMI